MSKGKNCIIEYERNNWKMLRIIPFGILNIFLGWIVYIDFQGKFSTYIVSGLIFSMGLCIILAGIYQTINNKVKVEKRIKLREVKNEKKGCVKKPKRKQ